MLFLGAAYFKFSKNFFRSRATLKVKNLYVQCTYKQKKVKCAVLSREEGDIDIHIYIVYNY